MQVSCVLHCQKGIAYTYNCRESEAAGIFRAWQPRATEIKRIFHLFRALLDSITTFTLRATTSQIFLIYAQTTSDSRNLRVSRNRNKNVKKTRAYSDRRLLMSLPFRRTTISLLRFKDERVAKLVSKDQDISVEYLSWWKETRDTSRKCMDLCSFLISILWTLDGAEDIRDVCNLH